jgi:hypothetical protein
MEREGRQDRNHGRDYMCGIRNSGREQPRRRREAARRRRGARVEGAAQREERHDEEGQLQRELGADDGA